MKKIFAFILFAVCAMGAWAQTVVTTDAEIRSAIQTNNANIQLGADIDLSNSTLNIGQNLTVTIDMNGHKLDRKLTKRGEGGGQVITVRSGATLNLSNGTLQGGWGGAGGALVNEGGTVTLTDVTVTNNVADDRGGGICNREGGTLTMTGGAITNNRSNDRSGAKGGGGFFNEENATATLTNVTITGNEAKVCGGGGICNFGTLTLNGCAIQGNKANTNGGGIWEEGTLNIQGANLISANQGTIVSGGIEDDIYLWTDRLIHVTGSLSGSVIRLHMKKPGVFTDGYSTYNNGVNPATIFTSEVPTAVTVVLDGNEAKFASALPEGSVYYIERSWDEVNKKVTAQIRTLASGSYTTLTGGDDITIQPGYYVVNSNIERDDINLSGNGEHHLILCDGAQLEADLIYVPEGKTLHIYGQTYNSGKLYIPDGVDDSGDQSAAIGGHKDEKAGTIIIHGGTLDIVGHSGSAAIGGGRYGDGGDVTVYAGYVKAQGGGASLSGTGIHGAGIGGGFMGNGGNLTVYGGQIEAEGHYDGGAGIGSGDNYDTETPAIVARRSRKTEINFDPVTGGTVVVHGGYIEARGGRQSAGIGGGLNGGGANMTVHGGIVKAWGFKKGAGIGTGEWKTDALNYTGELTVTGGEIYAYGSDEDGSFIDPGGGAGIGGGRDVNGSNVTISGGYVYAQGGKYAAGIGSGCEAVFSGGKQGGRLTVTGGHVEAYGGTDAAGIGGGEDADGGTVIISGGYVFAQGNDWGAGIGGGEGADGGRVTITGGTVIARAGRDETGCRAIGPGEGCDEYGSLTLGDDVMVSSERRAAAVERKNMCWYRTRVRVEVCDHSDVTYTIDGTGIHDHHISHCPYCLHTDTAEHTFDEHGICTVCGAHASAFEAKIYMPQAQANGSFDGQTYHKTTTHLVVPDSIFRLPMATLNVPGYKFIGWEATTAPTEDTYTSPYTMATADTLYRTGNKYKVTGNICFVARYRLADVTLYDDEPNGEILNEYNGMKVNKVILSGRVFNKNNTWQPLSLPFSLSAEELATSPLAGCTLKELDTDSSYNDTENHLVYLYFKEATSIEAGKPYIIRWKEGNPVLSPEFENVTLTNKTADSKARLLMYKSLYSPQTFTSANKTVLYFNDNGVLVHPNGESPVTVGAFRAYFRLTNLMGADPDAEWSITSNIDLPQGIDLTPFPSGEGRGEAYKIIHNGLLFIERNGKTYNAQGKLVN